jgi:hypothetical protein
MGVSLPYRTDADPVNQVIDDFLREYWLHGVNVRRARVKREDEISSRMTGDL